MKKENYLCLDGQKIEITPKQLAKIYNTLTEKVRLSAKEVGSIATIGEYDFIVLEQDYETKTTSLLMKDFLGEDVTFGENSDFTTSKVKRILEDFSLELEKEIGNDNIVEHMVDLVADDGRKDYGKTKSKISLLTCDIYRKFNHTINRYRVNRSWWLATSYSPQYEVLTCCVNALGCIDEHDCCNKYGLRPFCILKSNVFVS